MPKFEEMAVLNDLVLERGVLCFILVSRKMIPDLIADYFTGCRTELFIELEKQWQIKSIDPVLLKDRFGQEIKECIETPSTCSESAIKLLHGLWKTRETGKMLFNVQSIESVDKILEKVQFDAGEILCKKSGEKYVHNEACLRLITSIEDAHRNAKQIQGFSTGIYELDKHCGGIERGKMYAIGALKKTGKSRFAIYLSIMLQKAGAGIFWNSLEMNDFQLNSCALAFFTQCDSKEFGKQLSIKTYEKIQSGINDVFSLDWVITKERTVQDLRARILSEKISHKIDVVIVDFIQRMEEPELRKDRVREVEYIAKRLADLSRELNVGMIVLSQLSGIAEKLGDDEMPNMSHFKESQGIPENADCIITLHNFMRRENPFNADGSYKLQEIHCMLEQRYGFSGCHFKFLGDLQTCNFLNHESPYETN